LIYKLAIFEQGGNKMTSKERVKLALNHKEPDKVPIDFGGQCCSMMHVTCVAQLREYYGLKGPVKVADPSTMTGIIEDDLKEAIGCDVDSLEPYTNFFGFKNENWKEWRYKGIDVLVPGDFNVTEDGKGGYYLYPQGDTSVPPSGHMPEGGYYFDNIIRQQPFDDDDELNYEDNLEEYKPVTDDMLEHYRREAERVAKSGRAVVSNFGYTGLGDISLIPGPSLKHPKGIRSIEEWYISPLVRPDYVKKVFEAQTEIAIENLNKLKDVVGDVTDVTFVCGTDFGTQISLFFSKEVFDTIYLPYYKKINNWIHENTNWKTFKHTCGAITPLIPSLIEAGFDILNPVQCSAAGMDPKYLKKTFGKDIVFWGGGVDTQKVLPFGTPEEVRKQVLERCEIFAPGGGFIFNAIHIVQCGTPVENIVAMINAVHEFNGDR